MKRWRLHECKQANRKSQNRNGSRRTLTESCACWQALAGTRTKREDRGLRRCFAKTARKGIRLNARMTTTKKQRQARHTCPSTDCWNEPERARHATDRRKHGGHLEQANEAGLEMSSAPHRQKANNNCQKNQAGKPKPTQKTEMFEMEIASNIYRQQVDSIKEICKSS